MIALSIRQPWCWVILNLGKDLENRHWSTDYRGQFLMHASKGMTKAEYYGCIEFCQGVLGTSILGKFPALKALPRGGIVGAASIADVIPPCKDCETHPDHGVIRPCGKRHGWHMPEQYAFRLERVRPSPKFVECSGKLGFFKVGQDVERALRAA